MNVQIKRVPQGDKSDLNEVWKVKELIRSEQSLLHQKWSFFRRIYNEGEVYILQEEMDGVVGFAIMNNNHYLSILAIHPEYQGQGLGAETINLLKEDYPTISCHTRVSNESAVEFYESMGFRIDTIHTSYYEDGEDSYVLEYSPE